MTSSSIRASLSYYLAPEQGGTDAFFPGTASAYRRKHDVREVDIVDMRTVFETFSIDKQGFELIKHKLPLDEDFLDSERVKAIVYSETAEFLKET